MLLSKAVDNLICLLIRSSWQGVEKQQGERLEEGRPVTVNKTLADKLQLNTAKPSADLKRTGAATKPVCVGLFGAP